MFISSLAVVLAAGSTAWATPVQSDAKPVNVPVTYRSTATSFKNIVEKGRARLAKFNKLSTVNSGSITNEDVTYIAKISVGGATQDLIVDTGSSNLWCGAHTPCEPTKTGKATGGLVEVTYGSGEFAGMEYTDAVEFAGLTVKKQSLGSALLAEGFSGVDGIIGFGPVDLTEDTVTNAATVPTFMDNLYKQGSIPVEELGVSFRPEPGSSTDTTNGVLTLGGTDPSRYTGSIQYFPKLTTGDASEYWGLDVSDFSYGSKALGGASAIIDTGTTLIYIPKSAYSGFLAATGGTTDETSGLASFTTKPTQDFTVAFDNSPFPLTPSQYLVPEAQYSEFGLTSGKYYAYIASGGSSGVDCIVGQKFMENYYAAFDTTHSQIGFAPGTS